MLASLVQSGIPRQMVYDRPTLEYLLARSAAISWQVITIAYTDIAVAATTAEVTLFTSAANQFIEVAGVVVDTDFDIGKGETVTMTVGKSGAVDRWHDSVDITGSGIGGAGGTRPKYGMMDGGSNAIKAYFTGSVNLDGMSMGSLRIWYRAYVLP